MKLLRVHVQPVDENAHLDQYKVQKVLKSIIYVYIIKFTINYFEEQN